MILNNQIAIRQSSTVRNILLACIAIAVLPIAANAFPQNQPSTTNGAATTGQGKGEQKNVVQIDQVEAIAASANTQLPANENQTVTFDAIILPGQRARIYSRIEVYVEKVFVREGDKVKEGQILARLSSPELENEMRRKQAEYAHVRALAQQASRSVDATRAGLMQARAKREETTARSRALRSEIVIREHELKRIRKLKKASSVSQSGVLKAESQVEAAKGELAVFNAQLDGAKAVVEQHEALIAESEAGREAAEAKIQIAETELEEAKIKLDHAIIRAPLSGLVRETNAVPGMLAIPPRRDRPAPLFELLGVDTVAVVGRISANQLGRISTGMPVEVQFDSGSEVAGKISRISPTVDPGLRTVKVEIDIDNRDGKIKVGMSAKVTLTLPNTAGVNDSDAASQHE